MSIKLKLCPFCGGKALQGMCNVWCETCGAMTVVDSDLSNKEVTKAWNKRVSEKGGLVDELVGACEELLKQYLNVLYFEDGLSGTQLTQQVEQALARVKAGAKKE